MLELTTGAMLLFSAFYGDVESTAAAKTTTSLLKNRGQKEEVVALASPIVNPVTLEQYVRDSFKDTPILAEIAYCESRFRHYDSKGRVIRGEVNSDDVGLMQINTFYHEEQAKELGMDIHTLEGNMSYAKWLYQKSGDAPWVHSSPCWKHKKLALTK